VGGQIVKICIQDPVSAATYLIDDADLAPFATNPDDYNTAIDVLFVIPSNQLVQELPASRLSESTTPAIQITDPAGNRSWVIPFDKLQGFRVSVPPADADDVVWFAMPTARDLIAAVPVFRKALVQHSS
jgi:hypothetical protein